MGSQLERRDGRCTLSEWSKAMNPNHKILLASALILIGFSSFGVNAEDQPFNKTITVCRIELTGKGKMATFRFHYPYQISTDENGVVNKVAQLAERKPKMVREDKLIDCMHTWKLKPSSAYAVVFSIGTTGGPNYISIVEPKRESLKLLLPEF